MHIAGFRVGRELGRGGFGVVLEAVREADGVRVALKLAHGGDSIAAEHLARETRVLEEVGPPATPALLGRCTTAASAPGLVLEFIAAPTLAERLRTGTLAREELAARALALADALSALHARGFVHLDLKPGNVFAPELEAGAARVAAARLFDFGLALPLAEAKSQRTAPAAAGTAEYMAPEQCDGRGPLDARTDLYAFGAVLFEMLVGRPPFAGARSEVLQAQVALRPPRPGQFVRVAPALDDLVLRCLEKDPALRFPSAVELRCALELALAEKSVAPAPAAQQLAHQSTAEKRPVALILFATRASAPAVQEALRSLGAVAGHLARGKVAAIIDGAASDNPVRKAVRVAQALIDRGLAARALVDLAAVTVQRRQAGPVRYLSALFAQDDRYPRDGDPSVALLTRAAADAAPELAGAPLESRAGVLRAQLAAGMDATVLQLSGTGLVGRDELLAALVASARVALSERKPTLASVVAEPGHGKSHLCSALLTQLREALPEAELIELRPREPVAGDAAEALRLLLVRTLEVPAAGPHERVRERLAAALGMERAAELWPATALALGLLDAAAPELQALSAAPGVLRTLALRAAGEALRARAIARPLCLVLDDAQFADDAALDALELAALAEEPSALFVCALGRPSFAQARPSFGERAARREVHRIEALAAAEAAQLCRKLLEPAESVPAAAIERIVQRTQGVPLLLVELVRGFKRDGLVRRGEGSRHFLATDELERLPDLPLLDWLAQRELLALPAELAAHARLAALLGAQFTEAELRGVVEELERAGLGGEFPLDAQVGARRLLSAGLVLAGRTGALSYRHALVRDAVAESVPKALAEAIHRAAARFYRGTAAVPAERRLPLLALHAEKSGERAEAAALYLELAEGARRRHAYLDAEATYTRALALFEDDEQRSRLRALSGRASMRYRTGRGEDALADFARARELAVRLHDARAEVELLLEEATALDWRSDFPAAIGRVREGRARVTGGLALDPRLSAWLIFSEARSSFREGRWEEAGRLLEEASARAARLGDAGYETQVQALLMLQAVLPQLARIDEAERVSAQAMALSREHGDQLHLASALNNTRNVRIARRDVAGAVADQQRFMQIGRELGLGVIEYIGEHNLGELLYLSGDLEAAERHAERAATLERRHPEVAGRPLALLLRARLRAFSGDEPTARALVAEVRAWAAQAVAEGRAAGALSPSEDVLARAVELAIRDDATAAEWDALLADSARDSVEQEPIEVLQLRASSARRKGHLEEARRALEGALALAARIPNVMEPGLRRIQLALSTPAATSSAMTSPATDSPAMAPAPSTGA